MLYIPEIVDYLKKIADVEVKKFLIIKFGEYFKFSREN